MLKFSKKLLYAIEAVVDIAYNSGGRPVQIREVTQRQGVPQRYLEQVMQRLVRAGILKGIRGPRGGYLLARDKSGISVGEITRVVMEMSRDNAESLPSEVASGPIGQTVVRPLWHDLQRRILSMMDRVTVEDLTTQAFRAGVPTSALIKRMPYSM
ncbi:RrF2 family transcriptional regulator [Magnetococcales bacterium HHB-1]